MPKKRSWTNDQLVKAVNNSESYRAVIFSLGLIPAGGNYDAVKRTINELQLDTSHFNGRGWNKGWKFDPRKPAAELKDVLVENRPTQSHKLKQRLIANGMKEAKCELCGWAEMSPDGRIPIELDHINGNHQDNRIENLRILCPNCHSLQLTHRGKNKTVRFARVL